jgi:hypothetical protein
MASIDSCIQLLEERGNELFAQYVELLTQTRDELVGLKHIRLVEAEHCDRSKLILSVAGTKMTSHDLAAKLRECYHLEMEMTAGTYVLAMTSVGDTPEGMERLVRALKEIDAELDASTEETEILETEIVKTEIIETEIEETGTGQEKADLPLLPNISRVEMVYTCAEIWEKVEAVMTLAVESDHAGQQEPDHAGQREFDHAGPMVPIRSLPWQQAVGFVSTEYAYLYPPGYPLIVPGEKVSQEAADVLQWYCKQGFTIEGLENDRCIEVWTDG